MTERRVISPLAGMGHRQGGSFLPYIYIALVTYTSGGTRVGTHPRGNGKVGGRCGGKAKACRVPTGRGYAQGCVSVT